MVLTRIRRYVVATTRKEKDETIRDLVKPSLREYEKVMRIEEISHKSSPMTTYKIETLEPIEPK